jgi:hypothetical protein
MATKNNFSIDFMMCWFTLGHRHHQQANPSTKVGFVKKKKF